MAYIKRIGEVFPCAVCHALGTHVVYDTFDDLQGFYCRTHAVEKQREQDRIEARIFALEREKEGTP